MARQVEWLCLSDPADYEGLGELEQHLRAAKLPYCTIAPGGSVSEQLARAQAVLVLLSADYLANNGIELDLIMQQYGQRGISVVPVLWRPAPWQDGPLSALPALPANGRAVTVWSNRDAAWMAVLDGLRCEAPLRRKRMVLLQG